MAIALKARKAQIESVADRLVKRGTPRQYPRNAVIINEGDESDAVFVVVSGKLQVYLSGDRGRKVVLGVRGPGEYVGEMAMADGVRSASVVTLEPCTLSVLSGKKFREILQSDRAAAADLVQVLIRRARLAGDAIRNLALLDAFGRVTRLLTALSQEIDGARVIDRRLTQVEIAECVGCTREMVSRVLKDLVNGGYVSIARRQIRLVKALPG
jgi:CRP/FNR family cyclic AMP-dependent transcriptional regulator